MAEVGSLRIEIEALTARFDTAMDRADRKLNALAQSSRKTQTSMQRFGASVDRVGNQLAKAGRVFGAFGATLSVGAFTALTRSTVRFADEIGKTADRVGVSTTALQEYRFAAELTGIQQRQLDIGLQRFSRRVADAAQGSGVLAKVFQEQGIALRDSNGALRSTESILNDYADAVQRAGSDQEALLLAFKAFDSEGAALVNTLRDGSAGLEALREQARAAGLVIGEDLVRTAEDVNDRWTTLTRQFQATFGVRILESLETVANEGANAMTFMATRVAQAVSILDTVFRSGFDGLLVVVRTAFELMLQPARLFFSFIRSGFDRLADIGQVEVFGKTIDLGASGFRSISNALDGVIERIPRLGDAGRAFTEGNPELQQSIKLFEEYGQQEIRTFERQKALQAEYRNTARERRRALAGITGGGTPSASSGSARAVANPAAGQAERAAEAARSALQSQAERLRSSTRTAFETLQTEIAGLNDLRTAYEAGLLQGFDQDFDEIYGRGIEAAQTKYEQSFDRLTDVAEERFGQMSEFAKQASRNMQNQFADFLFDPFEGGLKGMVDGFTDTLRRMAAESAASGIFDALTKSVGGSSGNLLGGLLGNLFGGFKADGGPVTAGTPYIVGERGPELFVPRQSGEIVPNAAAAGRTVQNTITVNVQGQGAVDKRSLTQIQAAVAAGTQRALSRNS